MRPFLTFVAFALVAACAESQPLPQDPAHAQRAAEAQQAAVYEQHMAQVNAAQTQALAAQQKAAEEQQRALNETVKAAAEKQATESPMGVIKKRCADSREERVAHAKQMISARMAAETRVLQHKKAIVANCTLGTKKTGAFRAQSDGRGFRVAPELKDDVQCKSLPAGLTKDDAYVILWRVREFGNAAPTGRILDREDQSPDDSSCESFDRAAGVDFGSITYEDRDASIAKLIAWKP